LRTSLVFVFIFTLFLSTAIPQSIDALRQTWSHTSEIGVALRKSVNGELKNKANPAVLQFIPDQDPDVPQELANAFGTDDDQRANLKDLFTKVRDAYQTDIVKEKDKANNLAAAFTFFISAQVVAYGRSEEPDDSATEQLFQKLQVAISNLPEYIGMSNMEKHRVHDWLICIGGFTMLGYADANQDGNTQNVAAYQQFAGNSLRLVFGIEPDEFSFSNGQFTLKKQ
jgi:hypothetical protein